MTAAKRTFAFRQGLENCRIPGDDTMLDNLFTPTHLIIILVIALLIFGPRKLPELGKGLGEGLKGFKDGMKGVTEDPAKPGETAHTVTPKAEESVK